MSDEASEEKKGSGQSQGITGGASPASWPRVSMDRAARDGDGQRRWGTMGVDERRINLADAGMPVSVTLLHLRALCRHAWEGSSDLAVKHFVDEVVGSMEKRRHWMATRADFAQRVDQILVALKFWCVKSAAVREDGYLVTANLPPVARTFGLSVVTPEQIVCLFAACLHALDIRTSIAAVAHEPGRFGSLAVFYRTWGLFEPAEVWEAVDPTSLRPRDPVRAEHGAVVMDVLPMRTQRAIVGLLQ